MPNLIGSASKYRPALVTFSLSFLIARLPLQGAWENVSLFHLQFRHLASRYRKHITFQLRHAQSEAQNCISWFPFAMKPFSLSFEITQNRRICGPSRRRPHACLEPISHRFAPHLFKTNIWDGYWSELILTQWHWAVICIHCMCQRHVC